MNEFVQKTVSCALAASILFTVAATGCTNKDKNAITDESGLVLSGKMPDKLPEGMSWYDFEEDRSIFDYLEEKTGGYFLSDITWYADRTWVFLSETKPRLPVYHVMSFDKDYKEVTDFVVTNQFGDNISLDKMVLGDRLYIDAFDFSTLRQCLYPIDEKDGSFSPDNKIELPMDLSGDLTPNKFAFTGSDIALLKVNDSSSIDVVDLASSKVKQNVPIDDVTLKYYIKYPEGIISAGSNKVIVWGTTSSNYNFGQTRYCLIDLESGNISALDEMEYINVPLRNLSYCAGHLVTVTDGGVYDIDTDAGTCKMRLSFNCSLCNRYLASNADLIYADEEHLLFDYRSRYVNATQIPYSLCTFTKSAEYPAAGRNILTVASTEELDYTIAEAIMHFNRESDTSYILFDNRYKANSKIDYENVDNTDRKEQNTHKSYSEISDKLTMDILSGNGPDILITNGGNERLSNKDIFLDLSDYLKNESGISESDYFTNAIEASMFDGALYQFPIGFYVDGILAPGKDVDNKNGLTFEEYKAMVDKICNGVDPLYDHQLLFSRSEIAAKLFANSSEKFIKDKKIDVNNDEFKAILDYCKDLPAQSYYEGKDVDSEWENLMTAKENMKVQPIPVYGFFEFEQFAGKFDDTVILGYPSADGRSASIASEIAVSIFSNTKDVDSCKKFLSILLSDDIQMSMFMNIPINKNCARQIALNDIEETNKHVADNEGQKYAKTGEALDPALADRYIEQLSSATTSSFVYHSISIIIYEEIPSYLEGQKSFEDVAKVINNRAQKVLDERN